MRKKAALVFALFLPCSTLVVANDWLTGPFEINDIKIIEEMTDDSWTIPDQVIFGDIQNADTVKAYLLALAENAKKANQAKGKEGFTIEITKLMELPGNLCQYQADFPGSNLWDPISFLVGSAEEDEDYGEDDVVPFDLDEE